MVPGAPQPGRFLFCTIPGAALRCAAGSCYANASGRGGSVRVLVAGAAWRTPYRSLRLGARPGKGPFREGATRCGNAPTQER